MRFGIVGNRHGHVFGMAKQVAEHPECDVVAVAEDHPPALEELGKLGDLPAYSDYRRMLDQESLDAIILTTANNEKADVIAQCIERGVNVLADKPVLTTLRGLSAVEDSLRAHGGVVYPWFTMRFNQIFYAAHRTVAEGKVGKVINCFVQNPHKLRYENMEPWKLHEDLNGGVIVDLGCHSVDLVRWFTGSDVAQVTARHSNLKFPQIDNFKDNGVILLELRDGSSALLRTDWHSALGAADFMDYFLSLTATGGALEVRDGADKHVRYATDESEYVRVEPMAPPHDMIQDFVNNVTGEGETVLTTRDAIEATRVTLVARQSAIEGRSYTIPS